MSRAPVVLRLSVGFIGDERSLAERVREAVRRARAGERDEPPATYEDEEKKRR